MSKVASRSTASPHPARFAVLKTLAPLNTGHCALPYARRSHTPSPAYTLTYTSDMGRHLLIWILFAAWATTAAARAGDPHAFDYFYLVRQWPATFCNDHSCTHAPPKRCAVARGAAAAHVPAAPARTALPQPPANPHRTLPSTPYPPHSFSFTIHGLWPQRNDGTWPEYCDPSAPFSVTWVLDLLPRLLRNWPSWAGPNRGFWAHEWTRHGTCAEKVMGGEHSFFKAVLDLHKGLKIEVGGGRAVG
jgi:ribonuclease I